MCWLNNIMKGVKEWQVAEQIKLTFCRRSTNIDSSAGVQGA